MAPSPENSPTQDDSQPAPSPPDSKVDKDTQNSSSKDSPPPPPEDSPQEDSQSPPPQQQGSSKITTPSLSPPTNDNGNSNTSPPAALKGSSGSNSDTSGRSPPAPKNKQGNSSGHKGPDTKVIVAVAVGAAILLLLFILCIRKCVKKKKKKSKGQQKQQYPSHEATGGGNQYYNNSSKSLPPWHNGSPVGEHIVKVPPPQPGGGGGWGSQSPLNPPPVYSGEESSNYSGGPFRPPPLPPPSPCIALGFNRSTFTYEELAAATGGFSEANLLGQGGFGYVHKGILPNGKVVAVKSLKSGSGQGEREFSAEVEIISRVHHRYLVSLVGYCIADGQRMLVYEFVPNNTLEYHLHGKNLPVMDFSTRLRIALGSAKGLAYLHEDCHPRIIHRDIKAANILLDDNFDAMVADFGLAKLSSDNYTHVSTRVMGTFGYLAPEYASSGKLTEKSDVFSFGVMLLELLTGRRPVDPTNAMEDSLVDWARPLLARALEDGNYNQLADPRLEGNYNPHEMQRMVACAAASIRHSAKKRPRMSQIVRALEGDSSLDDLNEGVKPGQSTIFNAGATGTEYSASNYNADMQRFRQLALSSTDFSSSDLGPSSSDNSRDMAGRH